MSGSTLLLLSEEEENDCKDRLAALPESRENEIYIRIP